MAAEEQYPVEIIMARGLMSNLQTPASRVDGEGTLIGPAVLLPALPVGGEITSWGAGSPSGTLEDVGLTARERWRELGGGERAVELAAEGGEPQVG